MIDSNNPDPAVLSLPDGGYLAVATSNHATDSATQDAFPIYFSDDLVHWELQGWRRILSLFAVCLKIFSSRISGREVAGLGGPQHVSVNAEMSPVLSNVRPPNHRTENRLYLCSA